MGSESSTCSSNSLTTGSTSLGSMASSIPGGTGTIDIDGESKSILEKYAQHAGSIRARIYTRPLKTLVGGKLLKFQHESIVMKPNKDAYLVIEWAIGGLSAKEVSEYDLSSSVGTYARDLSFSVEVYKVIEATVKVIKNKKYNVFDFNCAHFIKEMERLV